MQSAYTMHKSSDDDNNDPKRRQIFKSGYILHSRPVRLEANQPNDSVKEFVIRDQMGRRDCQGDSLRRPATLKTEACRAGAGGGFGQIAVVDISGRARGNILVDGRLLLIPSDAHSRALGENKVELGAEDTRSSSRCGLAELLQRGPLLGNDHLNDEIVLDAHAALAVDVAERLQGNIAGGVEFDVDFALVEVGLPASLDLLVGDGAHILMQDALAFAANLLDVLGAGRGNKFLRLLNAPIELAEPPSRLRIVLILNNARQTHLDGEVANRVDDRGQLDRSGKVGGGKDANRVLLVAWEDGAPNVEAALVGDLIARRGGSDRRQIVVEGGEAAVGGGWQMAGQQMAEGEVVWAMAQGRRVG